MINVAVSVIDVYISTKVATQAQFERVPTCRMPDKITNEGPAKDVRKADGEGGTGGQPVDLSVCLGTSASQKCRQRSHAAARCRAVLENCRHFAKRNQNCPDCPGCLVFGCTCTIFARYNCLRTCVCVFVCDDELRSFMQGTITAVRLQLLTPEVIPPAQSADCHAGSHVQPHNQPEGR